MGAGAGMARVSIRVTFLACALPRRFSWAKSKGVWREIGEALVSPHVRERLPPLLSPSPSLFPLLSRLTCLFPSTRAPVFYVSVRDCFFY